MHEKRAARRVCQHGRAKENPTVHDSEIVADYGRGSLAAGLLTAIAFGTCLLRWAVVA